MNKRSFFIVGKHAVMEALKNPSRKVLRIFLTEESKKNIHRESQNQNLLKDIKVYFKTKKELDNYCKNEGILHQGYVAEIEHLEVEELKEFIPEEQQMYREKLIETFKFVKPNYIKGISCRCCVGEKDWEWQDQYLKNEHLIQMPKKPK